MQTDGCSYSNDTRLSVKSVFNLKINVGGNYLLTAFLRKFRFLTFAVS